ncbi:hypothetical protein ZEAMMB73_Zm00001d024475 [Zea mays]|uniref:Uncharacterized protein n=1 Tax=Zea mays TaxID=4577 RepID=A0A1D6IZI5_MAIZE|nr:hypothetical protein ZEAMMB73_Zm00001d024475 [Zea mays]
MLFYSYHLLLNSKRMLVLQTKKGVNVCPQVFCRLCLRSPRYAAHLLILLYALRARLRACCPFFFFDKLILFEIASI